MPDPLPSDVVARLKSDPTAALAAALILAGSFPALVSWAMGRLAAKRTQRPTAQAEAMASPSVTGQGRVLDPKRQGQHSAA